MTATRYVHRTRVNRETGTTIQIVDTTHPDSEFLPETEPTYDADGHVVREVVVNRWMTICVDHSNVCTHPTLRLARWHLACPSGWCEDCRATLDDAAPRCICGALTFGACFCELTLSQFLATGGNRRP